MTDRAQVSPAQIAEALGQFPPTPEQAAVIAAPLEPVLVVAGAGAGKTETMAARVVWLVANGLVDPDQVLGLTFTRKAAQELTQRIRRRLAQLAGSALLRRVDPGGQIRDRLRTAEPEVSTYHAYAGRLIGEYGLLLPMEPSVRMLGETELWQAAHRVVSEWDGDLDTAATPGTVTEQVIALASELGEHLVDPGALDDAHRELEHLLLTLPPGPRQKAEPSKKLREIIAVQERRAELLPLVARLAAGLQQDGALDPGTQMSLAARLAAGHPEVADSERARFRAVMLDEYQDTGHAQRVLLSALFGAGVDGDRAAVAAQAPVAVTAVGDPMQSIYGWRGASAANLPYFVTDFPGGHGPAQRLELSTSWRNPPEALTLANAISAPLRSTGVPVGTLRPRPGAGAGTITAALCADVEAERAWVAEKIAAQFTAAAERGDPAPTAAVLVRRNRDSAPMAEHLRAHGLPVEIVGLGGLLDEPEVKDVVAMLRLAADPTAGSAAMRVLTGARFRLGAADLTALGRRVRALDPDVRTAGAEITDELDLADAVAAAIPTDEADKPGLGDAIADPGPADRYSPAGYARIEALAGVLRSLRRRLGQPLTEIVAEIERISGVAVEVRARPGGTGREHLDAFADVVADYAADPRATVSGFLTYLEAAETVEKGLAPGEVRVDADRVQILTVHAAKGLEWEVVAVPHLVAGVFPADRAAGSWLGDVTELPPQLRGDRAREPGQEGVPVLDLDAVNDRKALEDAIEAHRKALARRRLEEDRRLFYVAVTRTERVLLLSGHHWPETGKAKGPSDFLIEAREVLDNGAGTVDTWAPAPEETDNPLAAQVRTAAWPADPLGERRPRVVEGARMVLDALAAEGTIDPAQPPTTGAAPEDDRDPASAPGPGDETVDDPEGWARDVDLLLAERAATDQAAVAVELPRRMSVSDLVVLRRDPQVLAARLRRPVPFKPNPRARRGTAFHTWVERHFGATKLLDFDELPGAGEPEVPDTELTALQEAFLASRWALRTPVEIEVPFEIAVGTTMLRGRMDAVFADSDGGWTVVDWKTGAPPTGAEARAAAMQLAAYRVAWAELVAARTGQAPQPDRVRAAFHYVRHDRTVVPGDLPTGRGLAELLAAAGADESPY